MAFERISEADDPRVADYRVLSDPELTRRRGLFMAEGRLVVRRLIEDRHWRVRSLLLNEASYRALHSTWAAHAADTPVYVASAGVLEAISGFDMHRGCLGLAERRPSLALSEVLPGARTVIILEGVSNADNIGGVFRNAAAFGADAVLLSPSCADPLYRKAIRTSMAATLRVPFATIADWPTGLADVRRAGFTLVALTPREPADTIDAFASSGWPRRVALLIGAEGPGLSDEVQIMADHHVRIPITAAVDSLNLAVAAGIILSRLSGGPLSDKR